MSSCDEISTFMGAEWLYPPAGVIDHTSYIQNAIDAVIASGRREILLSPGTYKISRGLTAYANYPGKPLELKGVGPISGGADAPTIIRATTAIPEMFSTTQAGIRISDIEFDGQSKAKIGCSLPECRKVSIVGVHFANLVDAGLSLSEAWTLTVEKCIFSVTTSAAAIDIRAGCTHLSFHRNDIVGGAYAFKIASGFPINIKDNTIQGLSVCAIDATFGTVGSLIVQGNYFEMFSPGVPVFRIGGNDHYTRGFLFEGNLVSIPAGETSNAVVLLGTTPLSGSIIQNDIYSGVKTCIINQNPNNGCKYLPGAFTSPGYTTECDDWTGFLFAIDRDGVQQKP